MEPIYTQEKLVQFIYKETSVPEYFEIWNAVETDSILRRQYLRLYRAFKNLPKFTFSPSQKVVDKILKYSRNYA